MDNYIALPTFMVDTRKVRENIRKMSIKAKEAGVTLRPHFKTHQSKKIGNIFREYGIREITVSSLTMAEYFASDGWSDITVAFPFNVRETTTVKSLARQISLGLLVDSPLAVRVLKENVKEELKIWIKIDSGYHRCGIPVKEKDSVLTLVREIQDSGNLTPAGLLTHAGQTYNTTSAREISEIFSSLSVEFQALKVFLEERGFPQLLLSYGDTPSCSTLKTFNPFQEIRPGNFVYYDIQQFLIGSCREEEIAAAVACPVVGLYPNRGEVVIYGGAVHLSKQGITVSSGRTGRTIYGRVFEPAERGWGRLIEGGMVTSLSQEHGIVSLPPEYLKKLKLGDLLFLAPAHSCLAADLLKERTLLL